MQAEPSSQGTAPLQTIARLPHYKQPGSSRPGLTAENSRPKSKRAEQILVVDDDVWIVDVIAKQLGLANFTVDTTTDSTQVMDMLDSKHYDLVISDVWMPQIDGLALLRTIQEKYPYMGVLLLTAINDAATATQAMLDGASDYLVKPINETQLFLRVDRALERSRLLQERALYQKHLQETVELQTRKLREQSQKLTQALEHLFVTYKATLNALQAALDVRDQSAPGHCKRVSKLAVRLARRMGFSGDDLVSIEHGALLHDIGKLGIPDAILMKPAPLSEEERAIVEKHPIVGCQVIGHIDFLRGVLPIVRHHHERYDGLGYPDGLKGKEIPILARIFSVVDAFDAQTHRRPYNIVRSIQNSLEELHANRGTSFDPQVVDEFIAMLQESDGKLDEDE